MSIKVINLAKELEVSIDEVLDQLRRLYVDVDDEMSTVDEKIAGLIRHKFSGTTASKAAKKKKKADEDAAETKAKVKAEAKKVAKKAAEEEAKVKMLEEEKAAKKAESLALAEKAANKTSSKKEAAPELKEIIAPAPKVPEKPFVSPIRIVKAAAPEKAPEKKLVKPEALKKGEHPMKAPKHRKGDANAHLPRIEILDIKDEMAAADVADVIEEKALSKATPFLKKPGVKRPFGQKPAQRPAGYRKEEVWEETKPIVRKAHQKLVMQLPVNIRTLAPRMNKKPNELIQYVIGKGQLLNINQDLDEDITRAMLSHFGFELEIPASIVSMEKELTDERHEADGAVLERRAPVVTFMGHVDHGKTSLLDYIRNTMVAKKEKGGITQHIGAYKVNTPKGSVTFLDTPGHQAFTAMRARGANVTDVVVLVVAADDGVMPQTKEAIDHAKAAGVPIVVAINKCDLPNISLDRVKRELQQEDLMPEEWGGKTVMVPVSAKTGEGVDHLVEMLSLESELLELKANPKIRARGIVIESRKTSGQGVVVTVLVKNGTLHVNDVVLAGQYYGKVKAMMNEVGDRVPEALPATPVEILGLEGVPESGEEFFVVKDEKKARTLATLKQSERKMENLVPSQRATLEDLHNRILEGSEKELRIVLKADAQGSIEALRHSLAEMGTSEVKVDLVHYGVGNLSESDIMLAMVSNSIVLGFHVKIDPKAEELAKKESIDVHMYDIIYELIDIVKAAMEGLLEPEENEVFHSRVQVQEVFSAKSEKVAGCMVIKGTVHRKDRVRVKRGDQVVHEGDIENLRRFKDDVKDVKEGLECGINIRNFNDIRKNDIIETFIIEKIARRLQK